MRQQKSRLAAAEQALNQAMKVALTACFLFGLGLYGVFLVVRFAFKASMLWAPPLTQYSLLLAAFFGAALAISSAQNLRIDFLRSLVERRWAQALTNAASAVVCVVIAGLFAEHMRLNHALQTKSDVLSLPVWVMDLPFLAIFLLMALLHAVKVARPGGDSAGSPLT